MASSSSAAVAGGGGVSIITVDQPLLETKDITQVGVRLFLIKWEEYLNRVATVPGARARLMSDCIDRDVTTYWLDQELIPDKTDEAIKKHLSTVTGFVAMTIDEVFRGQNIEGIYKSTYPPAARVLAFFAQVNRLLKEYNLDKLVKNDKRQRKRLQIILADLIATPRGPARLRRLMDLKGEALESRDFEKAVLDLCVEHEEYLLAGKTERQGAAAAASKEIGSAGVVRTTSTNGTSMAKRGSTIVTDFKAFKTGKTTVLLTRSGKVVDCLSCGGNHWAVDCPNASAEERKRSELLSAAKGHRPVTRSLSSTAGSSVGGVVPASMAGGASASTTAGAPRNPAWASSTTAGSSGSSVKKVAGITAAVVSDDKKQMMDAGEQVDALVGPSRVVTKVLLDSGAAANIISKQLLLKAGGLENIVPSAVKITQADGITGMRVMGQAEVKLEFSAGTIHAPLLVVESDENLLILSNATLQEYGVNVRDAFLKGVAQEIMKEETSMEDVLTPSVELNNNTALVVPPLDKLFPDMHVLSEADKMLVMRFYERLPNLLYDGSDPIKHKSLDVDLRDGAVPQHCRARSFPPQARKWMESTRDTMLAKGWIRQVEGISEWASNMFPVSKGDGTFRAVCDYVAVNRQLKSITFPMPNLDGETDLLAESTHFGLLDAEKGYHQICLTSHASQVLALMILDRVYEATRLFPGVSVATAHFQSVMSHIVNLPGTRVWLAR
jgi:hypothetical protein